MDDPVNIVGGMMQSSTLPMKMKPIQHLSFVAPTAMLDVDEGKWNMVERTFGFTYRHEVHSRSLDIYNYLTFIFPHSK